MYKIYAVSDGTGRTAEQALQAVLTQFQNREVEIILKAEVRTESQIEEIVREVAQQQGFIVHTLVAEVLRENFLKICRIHNVDAIDLTAQHQRVTVAQVQPPAGQRTIRNKRTPPGGCSGAGVLPGGE